MTKQEIIDTLTAEGGKLWEKGGKHRVYFDTGLMLGRVGLDVESYKTGNIASARFQGERISNSKAKRMINAYRWAKLYYDLDRSKFYTSDPYDEIKSYAHLAKSFCDEMRELLAS